MTLRSPQGEGAALRETPGLEVPELSAIERNCRALLDFFRKSARELPWRVEPRNPYHTLVSELMAQQTQLDRVIPRFVEFIRRFPSLEAVAEAEEEDVLGSWSGLGYYRRAKMLHALAIRVSKEGGHLPSKAEELRLLPGIGPYTASAIASLAFGEATAVLDGNVLRVAARVLAIRGDLRSSRPQARIRLWMEGFFQFGSPGRINESMMELGALRCTPAAPECRGCPFEDSCIAHREGLEVKIPAPRPVRAPERQEWVAACVLRPDGALLLRKIDRGPILRGLWLVPLAPKAFDESAEAAAARLLPWPDAPGRVLSPVSHSITYRRMRVYPVLFESMETLDGLPEEGNWRWVHGERGSLPSSTLLEKIIKQLTSEGVFPRCGKQEPRG